MKKIDLTIEQLDAKVRLCQDIASEIIASDKEPALQWAVLEFVSRYIAQSQNMTNRQLANLLMSLALRIGTEKDQKI